MIHRPATSQSGACEIWIHSLGAKVGGGVSYLRAVVPELVRQLEGSGVRVVLLAPGPLDWFDPPAWFEVRRLPRASKNQLTRMLFDQTVLPLWLRGRKGAVLYCSGSFSPMIKPAPTVTLLRNALYFDPAFQSRETFARWVELGLRARLIVRGGRGCRQLHYPSESMKSLVESAHPELRGLGVVNSYGVNPRFLRREGSGKLGEVGPRDGRTTFLYVMTYTIHKNLIYLLRALGRAKQEGLPVRVAVTSDLKSGRTVFAKRDHALIREHRLIESEHLVLAGSQHDEKLLELYEGADACVFPSLCESFGHPLVEAMALGKPLVCADLPYAREICGEHAMYVDPFDPEALLRVWRDWPARLAGFSPAPLEQLAALLNLKPPPGGETAARPEQASILPPAS